MLSYNFIELLQIYIFGNAKLHQCMPRGRLRRAVTNHWFSLLRTMVVCTGRLPQMQMNPRVFHLLKCHRSVNRGFTGVSEKQMVGWSELLPSDTPSTVQALSTDVNPCANAISEEENWAMTHWTFWLLRGEHLCHRLYLLKQDTLQFPGMCSGKGLGHGPKLSGIPYSCVGFHLNFTHALVNNKAG